MSNENIGFIDQIGRGLGGLFRFLIRLLFVLVLAVALGAGIFFGVTRGIPAIDRAYVQPVRDNTAAIADLEAQIAGQAEQHAEQVSSLQERLTALEVQRDTDENTLTELQSRLDALEPLVDAQATRLEEIAGALTALDEGLATAQEADERAISELEDAVAANSDALETLAANEVPIAEAYRDLNLIKVLVLVTRAQLFIGEGNVDQAQADIEAARGLLLEFGDDIAFSAEDLNLVVTRLDLALSGLPDQPDRATDDLSAAWEILLDSLDSGDQVVPEETPAP